MYITENQSIGESVLFLLSARDTLASMVAESDHGNADEMIGFLLDEATDYEIMSLLVDGKLPEERYNEGHEYVLFSKLKEGVLMNASAIAEAMGSATFNDFMTKVDTVYPKLSIQMSMLEFFSSQNVEVALATMLSEINWNPFAKKAVVKGQSDVSGLAKAKADSATAHSGQSDVAGLAKAQQGQPGVVDQAVAGVKAGAEKGLAWLKAQANSAGEVGGKLAAQGSAFAKTGEGMAVGGAALAALLAYASAKTYKRFFSKAAKACAGQSGTAKTQCMSQYKMKAKAAQVADLSRGAGACAKTKNPGACKAAVQRKIASLKG